MTESRQDKWVTDNTGKVWVVRVANKKAQFSFVSSTSNMKGMSKEDEDKAKEIRKSNTLLKGARISMHRYYPPFVKSSIKLDILVLGSKY
jgi:hypothetical protein